MFVALQRLRSIVICCCWRELDDDINDAMSTVLLLGVCDPLERINSSYRVFLVADAGADEDAECCVVVTDAVNVELVVCWLDMNYCS